MITVYRAQKNYFLEIKENDKTITKYVSLTELNNLIKMNELKKINKVKIVLKF